MAIAMNGESAADQPLRGRQIVVTRAREQGAMFGAALERMGARVLHLSAIATAEPDDPAALGAAARELESFDWAVFTSANAVRCFCDALDRGTGRSFGAVRVCAVGPATAAALAERGVRVDLVPERFDAESAARSLVEQGIRGQRVLFPRAAEARQVIPGLLRAAGAEVTDVIAYRTVTDGAGAEDIRAAIAARAVDCVTFTSGSTARAFARVVGTELNGARVASIGPVTTGVLKELGFQVDIEADEYTSDGLARAIASYFQPGRSEGHAG